MTFGAPSPRPCTCRCTCTDPGPLAARLRATARKYVNTLKDGSEIHMDIDGEAVRPFWNYLFETLAEAGFSVSARIEGGVQVYVVHRQITQEATP